jgi:hypothetical protein
MVARGRGRARSEFHTRTRRGFPANAADALSETHTLLSLITSAGILDACIPQLLPYRPVLLLNCVGARCNPLTIDFISSGRRRLRPPHPRIRPSFRVLCLVSARASACVFKTGSKVTRTYQPVQLACYLTARAPSLCNHRCSRVRSFCPLAHILQVSGYIAKPISLRKHCCCLVALTSSSCGREQLCKDRLVSLLLDTFHLRIYRHCSPLDQSQDAEPAAVGCLESPGLPPTVARHAHGLHAPVSCKVLLASARMLLLCLRMCIGPVRTD